MWNLKCTIIPVIIGATGIVTRSLRKNLETVPGKHSIDSLQKTTILGTSHIIQKVLQCEAWSVSGGDHRWFKRSTRKKRPVTRDSISYNNNNNNNNNNIFNCNWVVTWWQQLLCMYINMIYESKKFQVGRATWEAHSSNLESWEPFQHLLIDIDKSRKTCAKVAGCRTFWILTSSQKSGN